MISECVNLKTERKSDCASNTEYRIQYALEAREMDENDIEYQKA